MKPNLLLVSFTVALMASSLTAEAQAPAAATPSPAGAPATKTALTKTDLRKLIENTKWLVSAKADFKGAVGTFIFRKGGTMTFAGDPAAHSSFYTIEAPDILKLYNSNPDKVRKAPFKCFRVNVGAMTAEQDVDASTISGNAFMKYDGPAPKK